MALFGSHAGRFWDYTVDDAGISFAYARNLASGHGLVLTAGAERVEYSKPVYINWSAKITVAFKPTLR